MRIFLAGVTRKDILKVLYSNNIYKNDDIYKPVLKIKENKMKINILHSYFYMDKDFEKYIHFFDNFLLDSGAFTFLNNQKGNIDWYDYIDRYIEFINKNCIDNFFELDIDNIVGYENVKKMRHYLENKTNKKCIPVWHRNRGLEDYIDLTKKYDYIAIGGIAIKEIKKSEYPYFTKLLQIAKENECKVHGLGFTNLKELKKYPFYSVDSTTWLGGSRFGRLFRFNGYNMTVNCSSKNKRLKNKESDINNFCEWIKYSNYAEKHYHSYNKKIFN